MSLSLAGLASGFDWRSVVDQLADIERAPQRRLRVEQSELGARSSTYTSLKTELEVLDGRIDTLMESSFLMLENPLLPTRRS